MITLLNASKAAHAKTRGVTAFFRGALSFGQRRLFFPVLVAAVLCSGCWGGTPPGRVTTTGVVKVAGDPLTDGQITFESVEQGLDLGVSRITPGGRFSLFLKPGTYRVGIVSVEGGITPAGLDAVEAERLRVPKRYATPQTSGLEYTIDASNRRLTIDIPK